MTTVLIQEFENKGLSDRFVRKYKAINDICRFMGVSAPRDIEQFRSLGPTEQMAVLAYREGVNYSATTRASRKKWVGYQDKDGDMFLPRGRDDMDALYQIGDFLLSDPSIQNMEVADSFEKGSYVIVKGIDIFVIFEA